jgi:hypothetical protein
MPNSVDVQLLEDARYAVVVDGIVRYVGSLDECRRRALIFAPKNDERGARNQALRRALLRS